ncbi:hypothetical protein ABW20_dc0107284 [Dactylellina cionopaga]|nr:hypothetical protein ABW20_dc0107284 [Dactylellina cionopaga]
MREIMGSNACSHILQILLLGLLSTSTVKAYYWGEVDGNSPEDKFDIGWQPGWRGPNYLNGCIRMDSSSGKLQSFGIINGAPNTDQGIQDRRPHNAQAMIFYKSNACSTTGTNQFVVIRFKRDVELTDGQTDIYRGIQLFDLRQLDGVDLSTYNSYKEIGPESREWAWVEAARIPPTLGRAVVFGAGGNGDFRPVSGLTVLTPDRSTIIALAGELKEGRVDPAKGNLRMSLARMQQGRIPDANALRVNYPADPSPSNSGRGGTNVDGQNMAGLGGQVGLGQIPNLNQAQGTSNRNAGSNNNVQSIQQQTQQQQQGGLLRSAYLPNPNARSGESLFGVSTTIPDLGPEGTFRNIFGGDLPVRGRPPELEAVNPWQPKIIEQYGDARDSGIAYPLNTWRGAPTSPSLRSSRSPDLGTSDEVAPGSFRRLNGVLDNFLANPPRPQQGNSQSNFGFSQAPQANQDLPPSRRYPLEQYEAPGADPGTIREFELEEEEHFPQLFDPSDPRILGDMEIEELGAENLDADLLAFDDISSRTLNPRSVLYEQWRYKHFPVLGNLQTLPVSYADPNWEIIKPTFMNLMNELRTEWRSYYKQSFDPVEKKYDAEFGALQKQWNRVYPLKGQIDAAITTLKKQIQGQADGDKTVKLRAVRAELSAMNNKLGVVEKELKALKDAKDELDKTKKSQMDDLEQLYHKKGDDLILRYNTWVYMAEVNIDRNRARFSEIDKDPTFGDIQ